MNRPDGGGCGGECGEGNRHGPLVGIAEAKGDAKASNDISRIDPHDAARRNDNNRILQPIDNATKAENFLFLTPLLK